MPPVCIASYTTGCVDDRRVGCGSGGRADILEIVPGVTYQTTGALINNNNNNNHDKKKIKKILFTLGLSHGKV